MITEALVSVVVAVAGFVVGLFPVLTPPAWLTTTLPSWIETAGGQIVAVDALFPFSHAVTVLTFVALSCGVALAVKLVRIVASFLTAGGGSAA